MAHSILGKVMKGTAHPLLSMPWSSPVQKKVPIYCWVERQINDRFFQSLDGEAQSQSYNLLGNFLLHDRASLTTLNYGASQRIEKLK